MTPTEEAAERELGGQLFTLATGPSGATARTLAALGAPLLHHQDPRFRRLYREAVELLGRAFGGGPAPVIMPGEAVLGLEAAVAALCRPKETVLVLDSGVFGRGFVPWARRWAGEVAELGFPEDRPLDPEPVRRELRRRPEIKVVFAVHCETFAGVVNPLTELGQVVAESGALLVVDAVASFAGMPVDPLGWPADVVVAGSEKCLGGPPGLSLVWLSERARERIGANPEAPRGSFLSLSDWRDVHLEEAAFPFAPSVAEVGALRACLGQYLEEGPDAVHRRHHRIAVATRKGAKALGLSPFAADEASCADTVTVLRLPPGIESSRVLSRVRTEAGVTLTGGPGRSSAQLVRIGHMGPSAFPMAPVLALTALGVALRQEGFPADIGAAVEAAASSLFGEGEA